VTGSTWTYAYGINDAGQIVVNSDAGAFLFENGSYTPLNVPGSDGTVVSGINASGQIVGYYYDCFGTHGFLATPVP
jgi:uncharacterized membrane protein